jgi:hypothetical protein
MKMTEGIENGKKGKKKNWSRMTEEEKTEEELKKKNY